MEFIKKIIGCFKNKKDGKFTGLKNGKILISVLLVVFIVIIFAGSFKTKNKSNNVVSNVNLKSVEYCELVENRLCNVLRQMKGIGNVNVFLMVEEGPTIKYLEESKQENITQGETINSSIETSVVLVKDGTVTNPVVVVELLPKITGVLIVASGAKDIKLKNTLINAVSAILNINVSKVEVLEGK